MFTQPQWAVTKQRTWVWVRLHCSVLLFGCTVCKSTRLTVPGLSLFSLRVSNTTSRADGPEYEPCSQISVINMRRSAKMKAKQNAVLAREMNFLIPVHKQLHNHNHRYESSICSFFQGVFLTLSPSHKICRDFKHSIHFFLCQSICFVNELLYKCQFIPVTQV